MRVPIGIWAVLLTLAAGCASTTFTSSWKAPDAVALDPHGHRVAAVYITNDEATRREAEDTLVRKLDESGAQGVASYTLIPNADVRNLDEVKARLADAAVDGVLVMRVIDEQERTRVDYRPGPRFSPYYRNFWGYWGYGWGAVYPYGRTETTTTREVRVETLLYSVRRDALLWAGTSRTVDPGKVANFVSELADAAAKEMRRQKLLA